MFIGNHNTYVSKILAVIILITTFGCLDSDLEKDKKAENLILEVKQKYAPDKRVAVFALEATISGTKMMLSGETDQEEGLKELVENMEKLGFEVDNQVELLPNLEKEGGNIYGVINNSVSNIRSESRHSAELATQAILGRSVKILKQEGEWYLIQTPDKYISWIDHGGLIPMNENSHDVWEQAEKVVFLSSSGYVYTYPEVSRDVVGDLVMGSLLKLSSEHKEFYEVQYPDGRKGFVEKSKSARYSEWLSSMIRTEELLIENALSMKGAPYLWGGTSSKAMDCSGFTKTIYLMNGYVIPRDASQQVNEGKVVDANLNFEGLEVGDLLFFGKKATDSTRQRTTHVGMWIGDNQFIHSSKNVRISSINENSEFYDSMNVNRYLGAKRYLGNITEGIIDLTKI
ncbi:MAG: C40 family peptidase [Cyclobacteriaceae bacterium]